MIPYGKQSVDQSDLDEVIAVLRSDWLTQGPKIPEFEDAVAEYVGAKHAVAFSSATAALHGSMAVAEIGTGDTVVTSPLTFMASANCARYVGATPALVDIDPTTWNMDLTRIDRPMAGAVVVHYAGLPVDLGGASWKHRPRVVVEDASHALGASTPDGKVGNCAHSDMCCFSFHPVKPITTGEGGIVTTNDDRLAERLRAFRTHGIKRLPERGEWYYEISELGYNYRMTDISAALGISQLRRLDDFIRRRNEVASRYRLLLADLPVVLPPVAPSGFTHGYHLFAVLVRDRDRVFDELRQLGIGVQVHYVPVHHHPISKDVVILGGDLRNVDGVYNCLISLPEHPSLSDSDQDRVISMLSSSLAES